ncbi:ABC transporter permease [Bacillus aquiflavi]|uniref:Transport permease protein n=1 Tax=Bacillus aquiflavi TaxID=2672567 RepID=A0A6B3VZI6_9BACI|nr:ABC transporter permease [Bacillus aquiflavi]MBA4536386.1 ABC transporter permease [Bacillus aquiflavi]NEY80754.1 ABC transporter permease [Bacillus aquiflavi]UAC48079.1 ABC transporter permease [Bacillus aquiflavi]
MNITYYIKSFFLQAIISYKALFGFFSPKIYILVKVVNPIFQLIFFSMLAGYLYKTSDITPWVIGNAFLLCTYNILFGVAAVMVTERMFGTLKPIVASPANKLFVFLGRGFMHVIDSSITVILGFFTGFLFFNLDFSNVDLIALAMTVFISMFAATGFGLLIASIGLLIRDLNMLLNVLSMLLLIITGANIPLSLLPDWAQLISYSIPITRGIEASRQLMDGATFYSVGPLIGQELIVGIIYMLSGFVFFKVIERLSKIKGTLESY